MLKPASTRRRDDDSRDAGVVELLCNRQTGWVVQGVAQRPWGVEEDLALLMHIRDRVWWQSVSDSQFWRWIAQLMTPSRCHGADWCIRGPPPEATMYYRSNHGQAKVRNAQPLACMQANFQTSGRDSPHSMYLSMYPAGRCISLTAIKRGQSPSMASAAGRFQAGRQLRPARPI